MMNLFQGRKGVNQSLKIPEQAGWDETEGWSRTGSMTGVANHSKEFRFYLKSRVEHSDPIVSWLSRRVCIEMRKTQPFCKVQYFDPAEPNLSRWVCYGEVMPTLLSTIESSAQMNNSKFH
jgi:hypothetical protein